MRLWWEEAYGQPSLANPLFEAVPLAEWISHLIAKHLRRGGGVMTRPDGNWELTKDPQPEQDAGPYFTGDDVGDTMERRIALGLEPDAEAEEPP